MAGFQAQEYFYPKADQIRLLPLRFERLSENRYLTANAAGELTMFSSEEFSRLVQLKLSPGDRLYEKAYAASLITNAGQVSTLQTLAMRLRSRMSFLQQPTPLHLFVVTLRCEHSCPYCQVSRQSADKMLFDMTEETAMSALRIALEAPAKSIKIEFQGGEPLLNYALIKKIIEAAENESRRRSKAVDFVIATNLALITDEILDFCKTHNVLISTSLDGPEDLHNKNRPRPGGNSYALAVQGIRKVQQALGKERVGALMTTTEASLSRVEEIIDEYVKLDLDGIFLRPLSPYGFAVKTKQVSQYDTRRWLEFYKRGLRYILRLNQSGRDFREFYSALLLQRLLTDRPIGYVDLRSPSGVGLGALVYNYDGRVFASDEGRMLAEMGDRAFELGHVADSTYRSLVLSDTLVSSVSESLTQCAPECHACVYESHCGADPVYHHATQSDVVGIKPISGFCAREKGVVSFLWELLETSPEDAKVLRRWGNS
ncbi:MAG: His-Xaa-Ser system radical SAM maturase HxsB [Methylocystis sp.]